jgi:hypothetical protein
MADHLKIDFEALAIDVHLMEGTQVAVLTIVSIDDELDVSLPLQALEEFQDRISRMLAQPGLNFFLHPSHRPPAQAHRPGKCALRDAQINRAARQARAGLYRRKPQYRVRHLQSSLREFGSMR